MKKGEKNCGHVCINLATKDSEWKKSILLPSPNHFVRFTPQTKYWLNLLPPPMHTGLI